ncbi:MAG: tetratricopeptide repeat protein, partial [Bacteroidota bacterium]
MKAIFLLTALLIFGSYSPAQELNGKIHEGLSEKGLKNVRLSISGYTESRSDDFGRFSIDLPSKNRGALVNLDVLKEGYAVINREALKARIPDNDSEVLLIYMCASNNRDQLALKYYQIQVNQNIKRNFQAEAKILADQMNYEAMAELGRKKEIAEQMTDSLAARLARFDPKETTEELTRAMQFFQQGNIDSALAVIDPDKIISRIKQRDNLVDQLREANKKDIMALLQAADFALSDFQFQTAENYYQKALEGDSSNFDALGSYAQFLATQNKSDKLIPHAKWMLKKSKNNEQKATSLRFLGNSLYLQKKINEAGQALEKALKIKREMALSGSDSDKSELSLILNSLSRVYTAQNTLQTAIDLLEEAKEIDEELAKKGEVGFKLDLTQTLVNLGVNYTYANRFEEALENFKRAVDILETLNKEESGPYEENLAFALGNLGLTLRDLNKFKEAIPVLERSRDIRKKLSEQNPAAYEAELAKSLNSLGITYRLLSRYKEANSSFQEALSIKRKLAEANPSRYTTEVANLLNNLGLVDQDQKKYKESETHFQEAIDICKKQEKKNPKIYRKNLSIYYTNLGNTYSYLGQSQKAAEKLKEALKIYSNLTSEAPERYKANLADTYLNIGTVYSDLGKKSSALSSYQEALEIYQDLVQENPAR